VNELALFAGAAMKICKRCLHTLPEQAFYRRGTGFRSECKACAKAMTANWYAKNGDAARAKVRQWTAENGDKLKAYRAANRRKHYLQELGRKYGVTGEWFEQQMNAQGAACACCRRVFSWDDKQVKPHVDHCHISGKVRGLLCNGCNTTLGIVGDSVERLVALAEYLKCHG